jgi:8-oxo-dGTP pyrophosphatase MutT (NUDIX family)
LNPIQETSFGIIPTRYQEGRWQLFLVLHRRGLHWAFPKGHPAPGEKGMETALRELREETGLQFVKLLRLEPFEESYRFCRTNECVDKHNYYYLASVSGEVVLQFEEVMEGRWVDLEEALSLATHPQMRFLCQQVRSYLIDFLPHS